MIDGLRLTIPGEKLRALLEAQIERHKQHADWWESEQTRTPEGQTEEAPLLPDHMCTNEAERHVWRAEVLGFIRDHVEVSETYRLSAADLEFSELLPSAPGWLTQDEYEERTRVGFALERVAKGLERGVGNMSHGLRARCHTADVAAEPIGRREDNDEFRTTRLDLENGPEIVVVERK
jgi:hypothetical protein